MAGQLNKDGAGNTEKTNGAGYSELSAILPPLASCMKVDLLVNEQSQVWLLHDQPFSGILRWAEYDAGTDTVTLIMDSGQIQEVGLPLSAPMRELLAGATLLHAILMGEKYIKDVYRVPLVAKSSWLN